MRDFFSNLFLATFNAREFCIFGSARHLMRADYFENEIRDFRDFWTKYEKWSKAPKICTDFDFVLNFVLILY